MKLNLDQTLAARMRSRRIRRCLPPGTPPSVVRRLWAIQDAQGLRVLVALEPTPDGRRYASGVDCELPGLGT